MRQQTRFINSDDTWNRLSLDRSALENTFAERLKDMPDILPVSVSELPNLKLILPLSNNPDSYCLSPSYYGLTGRRGLWVHAANKSIVIFCLHPNFLDTLLIFPSFGENPAKITEHFLEKNIFDGLNLQLARGPETTTPPENPNIEFIPVDENRLDWKYPVRTVCCKEFKPSGRKFRALRTAINRFESPDVNTSHVNFLTDTQMFFDLVRQWEKDAPDIYGQDELRPDYYTTLWEMGQQDELGLEGIFISVNESVQACAIWEMPLEDKDTANFMATLVSPDAPTDLNRYLVQKSGEILKNRGVLKACLGGSETSGMDKFKSYFPLAGTFPLQSYNILIKKKNVKSRLGVGKTLKM